MSNTNQSSQVISSLRNEASATVEGLTNEMKAQKLCLIYLFFRQWTGQACLRRFDYSVGKDGKMPSQMVAASYGNKRLIDPKHLRIFKTLKSRAEALLDAHGIPFCKGMVIPLEGAENVINELRKIAEKFNRERDELVADLPRLAEQWQDENPEFRDQLATALPDPELVRTKMNADFGVMQFQPLEALNQGGLDRAVDDLFDEILIDVAKRAKSIFECSIQGRAPEDLTLKTLSGLRSMKSKLEGLEFISPSISGIQKLINQLLGVMPKKGQKFTAEQFNLLSGALGLLQNEGLLRSVADGKTNLSQYMAHAFPESVANATEGQGGLFLSSQLPPVVVESQPQFPVVAEPVAQPSVEEDPEALLQECFGELDVAEEGVQAQTNEPVISDEENEPIVEEAEISAPEIMLSQF